MKRALAPILLAAFAATVAYGVTRTAPHFDTNLPVLGTKFHSLPPGRGKRLIEASCFPCHSADMLVQQQLSEKQWSAALEKMIRWGALVKEQDKSAIVDYLSKHFGPGNKFTPIKTRPAGY